MGRRAEPEAKRTGTQALSLSIFTLRGLCLGEVRDQGEAGQGVPTMRALSNTVSKSVREPLLSREII